MIEEVTYTIAKTLLGSFEERIMVLGEGSNINKIYKHIITYEYGKIGISSRKLAKLLEIDIVYGKAITQIGIDSGILQLNNNKYTLSSSHRNQLLKIMKERSEIC